MEEKIFHNPSLCDLRGLCGGKITFVQWSQGSFWTIGRMEEKIFTTLVSVISVVSVVERSPLCSEVKDHFFRHI